MVITYRHGNDGLAEEVSVSVGVACDPDEDKTVQSAKDDADINVILKRFNVGGGLQVPNMEPFYANFGEVDDFQTALNKIMAAEQAFGDLSSDVRNRFENDPAKLISFLDNPDNYEEAEKLGLLREKVADPGPQKVVVENWPEGPKA